MKRTLRTLAVPVLAALMLAGCGGTEDAAKPAQTQQSDAGGTTQSDGGGASDDGGAAETAPAEDAITDSEGNTCKPDDFDEIEGLCVDESVASDAAVDMDAKFGGPLKGHEIKGENGEVYTLGAPEEIPDRYATAMRELGYVDKAIDGYKAIPVEIDNTKGESDVDIFSLTVVGDDGEQIDFPIAADFLYDAYTAPDNEGTINDPDVVTELEHGNTYVVPTAKKKQYFIASADLVTNGEYTYIAIDGQDGGAAGDE